ncbi:MAG: DUF1549 and DUF1553 domain-containing protein [Gemmataceae bacterium]
MRLLALHLLLLTPFPCRADGPPTDPRKSLWSLQPVKPGAPPHVKDPAWQTNPIDRFIRAKLDEKGLTPAGLADKRTLLRRVTYDLTGLPPTPDEIAEFLRDGTPRAWAKTVDRLLASRQYAERWGRYWLDVVRYADTAGDNSDYPIPQMRLYRDWVIDAFDIDMKYPIFVRRQIAGDLMPAASDAGRRDNIIATGYLANSRRHGSYEDARYPWHLTIEDTIDNLGKTFLGLSLHCARCHDHKFDPITSDDYYALYGFFSSTRYPWPGIELDRAPHDLVPLPGGKTDDLAYAVIDGKDEPKKRIGKVGNARVMLKGDPDHLGKEVPRRFPMALGGMTLPPGVKGSGRLELANWLTDKANPLTARVMVNRIWQYHFGRGLVPTANDFGKQGQAPSHPELLDFLADYFMTEHPDRSAWSVKNMHRLILMSRTYQLASEENEANLKRDPADIYLWRYPPRRLDAEAIRDALLFVSGNLEKGPGGPHPFPDVKKWDFTQHKPFKAVYDSNRRSVYLMTQRIQRHPFLALFDGPDTNASTASRPTTTTPLQALFLMNNPFVHEQARKLADRLLKERKTDPDRIERAFLLLYGRPPSAEEVEATRDYLSRVSAKAPGAPAERERSAWESLSRALFMSNEFVYLN